MPKARGERDGYGQFCLSPVCRPGGDSGGRELIYALDTFADRPKAITPVTATHYTWIETERVVGEVL